jgi:hypothetical protein
MAGADQVRWCWPRRFDADTMMRFLQPSLESGHMTNNGPASRLLEEQAISRLRLKRHVAVATASGSAALATLVATYRLLNIDLSRGILVSAFGFPPNLQLEAKVTLVDVDTTHGGPILPPKDEPPSVVCLVNPFGYRVDVQHYRKYCDELGIPLWMDNAACPLHIMPDGSNVADLADAATISLHETKVIGRGEGGLVLLPPAHKAAAYRAINFGYDPAVPAAERPASFHPAGFNRRMSDVAASAILASWELNWGAMVEWTLAHDSEVVDVPPFLRGAPGSLMTCIYEPRQPRPGIEVKNYYHPLAARDAAPNAWAIFDRLQCRPFHPPGGALLETTPSASKNAKGHQPSMLTIALVVAPLAMAFGFVIGARISSK